MFTIANRWDYTKHNPTKDIQLLKEPPGRVRYLTKDEIERLLSHCKRPLKSIVVVAFNTGMRKREILNLKWLDIDLSNRVMQVGNSKNNERRIIYINDTLYLELRSIPRFLRTEYVFCSKQVIPFDDIKKSFATAI